MQNRTDGPMSVSIGGGQEERRSTGSVFLGGQADSLAMHILSGHLSDPSKVSDLCFCLARSIDDAVANNEVPLKAQDLPMLVKQVYKHNNHSSLQAAVMALMISVKNACRIGWFQNKDSNDLLTLAKEIGKSFSNTEDFNVEPSYALSSISKIMARFYPRIKMGHILASLEIKAGYRAIVYDFHILKSTKVPVQNQIALFVAQMDNMETSSCIVTPPLANFLLNGKGVQGRNNISMDTGPQLPTNITAMLKYGINLFQAVGQFNGNYLITIAFMSMMPLTDETPSLQDYVQPVVGPYGSDTTKTVLLTWNMLDSEIIERPSRISLNCPISHKRIKTPVKGHLCNHYQLDKHTCFGLHCILETNSLVIHVHTVTSGGKYCLKESDIVARLKCFDYENFMEMNARRPLWCCPCCNQPVCHTDIRIDEHIAKILGETEENVVDVMISADGSWMAVLQNNDHTDKTGHGTPSCQQERPPCLPDEFSDLTKEGANAMHVYGGTGRRHLLDNPPCIPRNVVQKEVKNSDRLDQHGSCSTEENMYSRIPMSISAVPLGSVGSTSTWAGTPDSSKSSCNSILAPVLTDTLSPVLNQQSLHGGLDREQQLLRPLVNSLPVSNMASSSMRNHTSIQNQEVKKDNNVSGQDVQQADIFPTQGQEPAQFQRGGGSGQAMHDDNSTQTPLKSTAQPMAEKSRTPLYVPVQLQPSGTDLSSSLSTVAERPRGSVSETTHPQGLLADGSATLTSAQNLQPSGRMKGSLTGMDSLGQGGMPFTTLLQGCNLDDKFLESQHTPLIVKESLPQVEMVAKKRHWGGKFSVEEDNLLVSAWLNTSLHTVTEEKHKSYWERIWEFFLKHKAQAISERSPSSLMNRWTIIKNGIDNFCDCLAQIESIHQSDMTEHDKILQAKAKYQQLHETSFSFEHCWTSLRHQGKWLQRRNLLKRIRRLPCMASSPSTPDSTILGEDNVSNDSFQDSERPITMKDEKEKRKREKSTKSDDAVLPNSIRKDKLKKLTENLDEARDQEKGFTCLEQEKTHLKHSMEEEKRICMRQEMFRSEQAQKELIRSEKGIGILQLKRDRLQVERDMEEVRIMAIDTSAMSPMQQQYFQQRQVEILERQKMSK
ncbi:E4 SUMO-protein ligase PIAL2-like isoform X4 [Carya illinoinensis]|uniref:SP-RING-type domain-containing protein n=1 Tax=Carya illinoinensis TaxID=32201 RepID=A0A8T1RJZ1_CARIL|nr:E4 SUMO-protein ligase PIAL2-like isoform X4 [Carya illinoinensis]KAG6666969.1 hypothetical protein CIPAW_01G067900 [Carya illinoinensis]